ncbi:hypothetical protein DMX12_26680 [Pseudomonas sp. MB-090624]|nr:hypothetical protein DMX12_26680 [Pseudomonas sp. MB-090624]
MLQNFSLAGDVKVSLTGILSLYINVRYVRPFLIMCVHIMRFLTMSSESIWLFIRVKSFSLL